MKEKIMAETESLPSQIEYLIKNMLDNNVDVWKRQTFRTRLARIRDQLNDKLSKYDSEYEKANRNVSPFKRVTK
jgi:hypothetical protein